jgi:K+-transporting ATPase ATPase C chain
MSSLFRPALACLVLLTALTGVFYPLFVTGVAQLAFPFPANGSLIRRGDTLRGSALIGQQFDDPRYFWGRLSATTPAYNAEASTGSNFGPLNPALQTATQARIDALRRADPRNAAPIPIDLATASASGLDPHLSPAAALYQVPRVAAARGIPPARVERLVRRAIQGRTFGVLGEPTVNVLLLNLSLDNL